MKPAEGKISGRTEGNHAVPDTGDPAVEIAPDVEPTGGDRDGTADEGTDDDVSGTPDPAPATRADIDKLRTSVARTVKRLRSEQRKSRQAPAAAPAPAPAPAPAAPARPKEPNVFGLMLNWTEIGRRK